MKYKIPKKQKGGDLLKENNSLDPIYEGGMIPAAVSSYKYTMEDYDNLASKKNLNQVPSVLQSGVMKAKVRGAINKGVKDVLLPTIGVAAAPIISTPIISSAIASPSAFIGSIIGGMAGQVGTDKIVQKASGNKYSGWGDMVSKKTGLNPIVSEFTNPGGLIGGGIGAKTGNAIIKKGIPGITIDAPELGFHALNKNHWALHPSKVARTREDQIFTYGLAAVNRTLPIINKTPLVRPLKKLAEKVMSKSASPHRTIDDLKNIKVGIGRYDGSVGDYSNSDRNLIKLYLYGNEKGFKPINKNVKTIDFGERYRKLYPKAKYYEMESVYKNGNPVPVAVDINDVINESFINKKPIKISLKSNSESPVYPIDDISGHQIQTDFTDVPTLITQDLWKFNPADYMKRWGNKSGNLLAQKQAGILDKLGKPFYLVQNNPMIIWGNQSSSSSISNQLPPPPDIIYIKKQGGKLIPRKRK